jgi:hypothetical protein
MTAEQEAALTESERAKRHEESDSPGLSQANLSTYKIDFNNLKATLVKQAKVNPFTCSARRAKSIILKRGNGAEPDSSLIDPITLHQNSFANGVTTESLHNSVNDDLWVIQTKLGEPKLEVMVADGSDEMPQFSNTKFNAHEDCRMFRPREPENMNGQKALTFD